MVAGIQRPELRRPLGDDLKTPLIDLVWPGGLPPLAQLRRAELISARTRGIALVLAPLSVLWIGIDAALLPAALWVPLALGRGAAGLAFVVLALVERRGRTMRGAQAGLVVLFAIPTLFYFYASSVLPDASPAGAAGALLVIYELTPFVIVGAVAFFPLSVTESAIVVLPVILGKVMGTVGLGAGDGMWIEEAGVSSLLLVLWGVAAGGAASQLHFMLALLQRASRDLLTGAFTRSVGEELFALYFHQSERAERPLSVVFVDLDDFKSVNDRYGHEAGDAVLRDAGRAIRRKVRGGDAVVRWGGDEFVILLPGASYGASQVVVDRIRADGLAGRPDDTVQRGSFGIAERIDDEAGDWQVLARIADERAYAEKAAAHAQPLGAA